MNPKDYKEIARIIKKRIQVCKEFSNEVKSGKLTYKAMVMREIITALKLLAIDLADYFERKDRICSNCKSRKMELIKNLPEGLRYKCNKCNLFHKIGFDREQFSKECRVER